MRVLRLFTFVMMVAAGSTARGDGLIYRLPPDGTWVRYEGVETNRSGVSRKFTLIVNSVGQATVQNEKCRWVEIRTDRGSAIIKLLIPEKRLKRGESPLDHLVRGWEKHGDSDVTKFGLHGGNELLPAFLGGPLENAEKLDMKVVRSKLGALMCEGLTGDRVIVNRTSEGEVKVSVISTFWLHDKAPFGVVAGEVEYIGFDGKNYGSMKFKVIDFGDGATSDVPEFK